MVTPFAWSQPHPANEHVAAAADELRRRGHEVVVLAPSNRAVDLAAGRRALRRLGREGVALEGTVALGPAIRVSRRSRMGVPVGVRANLELALSADSFDLVHAHEPGMPSLSYLALRYARGLTVATFHSPERVGYPPGRQQRERLLARIDALTAVGTEALAAAQARFPGDYRQLPHGIEIPPETNGPPARIVVLEWRADELARSRAALRALRSLPGWELVLLRTRPLAGRPYVPLALRGRVHVRTALDPDARARALRGAAALVPAQRGLARLALEAQAAGVPLLDPPGSETQPELVAAAMARLAENGEWRASLSDQARRIAERQSIGALGDELERIYRSVLGRRRAPARSDPLGDRPFVLCDLHMHTAYSHDCVVPVGELLDYAEAEGLGAIAITDHNAFAGAREAVQLARGRRLTVIPGEEVKTDAGEVIGLFLEDEIPRGMSMGDTIAAIREQNGIVYLPHPFDRLHTIPDAPTLHRHLAEIDVFEVYNARLLFEGFNDEALRFARKYNLTMGAGSDAHVLQGVGTGLVRMRAFETPEEFLWSLRSAEILRRPKSLVYLQGLKWVAQARERRKAAV
ncbi:MAG TPA: glycosyltransferase [Gaiellaceae bacterium]|jgi:predicted metal-dependent phosphoesterase TrpH/glycosyltransferase involved in cell wall biosynthesis|nr:glycosyltransferase [Gaiellaceae bacterium]